MSNIIVKPTNQIVDHEFTKDQLDLITATVAKGATQNELQLFLYRCKNLNLDPLKPGMVHFVKYGNNPGSIVVGIDGFRAKAQSSGKLIGIKRGILRDDNGRCVGAWCEVYRSDWQHPAREEVSLAEYNTGRSMWARMPETMIKKVAEVAALRMAFPDDLGGIYSDDEMDQSNHTPSSGKAETVNALLKSSESEINATTVDVSFNDSNFSDELNDIVSNDLSDYVIPIGKKYRGKKLSELSPETLESFVTWVEENVQNKGHGTLEFISKAKEYLEQKI